DQTAQQRRPTKRLWREGPVEQNIQADNYQRTVSRLMEWNGPQPQHRSAKYWSSFQRHKVGAVP
ncbi:hypothetical protein, partial [Mesorhizobium sp. M2E.F.Ca.ET.154.01.1.1]|uniref:hypothetical protein n=1 Tax=Mesorhizobium sp. M2E.F.Ca.ET.154.01.1.1 TaxID=2500521 RepID=UPI001AED4E01